jgi:AsmA protein
LNGLAAWVGSPLEAEGEGPLAISGKLETTATSIALTDADAQLDDASIKGFAVLETGSGTRPRLSADLRLSALDLTRWLTPGAVRPGRSTRSGAASAPDDSQPPRSIDDLLRGTKVDGPQVRGFIARHGWSDVPFNLAALGVVDANVKLDIDRLEYRDMKAGRTRITAALADRIVEATIDEMQLYEGSGRGEVHFDASGPTAALDADIQLDEIAAFDLLRDATEFDWIAGKGRISLAIKGQGRSEREIVETLDGKAEFAFHNGAVIGIDVPGIVQNLQQGRIPRLERNRSDKTAFSELAASFKIENGIAENRDLRLVSSIVHVSGAGRADLPRRTLDYTAKPKLLATTSGQANGQSPTGFELPVRITGSWDRPDIAADFDAVLKDPGQVVEAAKEIGKKFKGKKLGEALQNFLEEEDDEDSKTGRTKKKARDFLRKFIKPQ